MCGKLYKCTYYNYRNHRLTMIYECAFHEYLLFHFYWKNPCDIFINDIYTLSLVGLNIKYIFSHDTQDQVYIAQYTKFNNISPGVILTQKVKPESFDSNFLNNQIFIKMTLDQPF